MEYGESREQGSRVSRRELEDGSLQDSVVKEPSRPSHRYNRYTHSIQDLISLAESGTRAAIAHGRGIGTGFVRSPVELEPLDERDLQTAFPLLTSLPHPVLWINDSFEVVWSNPAAQQVYMRSSGSCHFMCHRYREPCFLHGEPCPKQVASVLGTAVCVAHVHQAELSTKFVEVTAVPISNGGVIEIHIPVEDYFAVDALTGTHTRAFFEQSVRRDLALMQRIQMPYGLVMLDLDHFKRLNDSHGHPAGDRVLKAVGETIMGMIRGTDCAGRWGGEEFCIFLPGIDAAGALGQVRRLYLAIRSLEVEYEDVKMRVTASYGIHSSSTVYNYADAVRWADVALYRAKKRGRDRIELD